MSKFKVGDTEIVETRYAIQYQYLQKNEWYDEPGQTAFQTIRAAREELNRDLRESRNAGVRLRIVKRETLDTVISAVKTTKGQQQ